MSDVDATTWAAGTAFVDGEFCPIGEAKISILDMGVTRSDCTYDVVSVWDGRFFRLDAHLDRFMHSVGQLRLDIGVSRGDPKRSCTDASAAPPCSGRTSR